MPPAPRALLEEAHAGVKLEDPEDLWPLPQGPVQLGVVGNMNVIVPQQKAKMNRLVKRQPNKEPESDYGPVPFKGAQGRLHAKLV